MCVFVSRLKEIATFPKKNGDPQKLIADHPEKNTPYEQPIMDIVDDFACEDKNL